MLSLVLSSNSVATRGLGFFRLGDLTPPAPYCSLPFASLDYQAGGRGFLSLSLFRCFVDTGKPGTSFVVSVHGYPHALRLVFRHSKIPPKSRLRTPHYTSRRRFSSDRWCSISILLFRRRARATFPDQERGPGYILRPNPSPVACAWRVTFLNRERTERIDCSEGAGGRRSTLAAAACLGGRFFGP